MELEQPHHSVPVPSPYPSTALEASSGLEVTPERPRNRREPRRHAQLKTHAHLPHSRPEIEGESPAVQPEVCSNLTLPRLHTTAPLYLHLHHTHLTKQQSRVERVSNHAGRRRGVAREGVRILRDAGEPSNSPTEAIGADPVKPGPSLALHPHLGSQDLNIPPHEARYTDLVSVDVSEESFRELISKPRSKPCVAPPGKRKGKGERGVGKREGCIKEPNIMDLFSSDFELEDISLKPRVSHRPSLEPVFPSSDCALTLYNFTNEL